MSWTVLLLAAALALITLRIYFKLRMAQKSRAESWDEQMIGRLRSQGYAPFNDYRVDFFLALPSEAACQGARARLEPEFSVDVKPMQDDPARGAGHAGDQPAIDRARHGVTRALRRLGRVALLSASRSGALPPRWPRQ